ncbi:MAG: hypothetical protein U0M02_08130 [Acutalibacteraceae bacterium]|nr:hypothetical protein [Acutalibacteraceae bacterium]
MKKIFHHPIIKAFIGIILFLLIFILLGFRITYHPSLDNNWEAISACAAWAAVVVSGLAIWYAIQVPKKIAEEQNKIALFEKRHMFYITFCKCISFCEGVKTANCITNEDVRRVFCITFSETGNYNIDAINNELPSLQYKVVSIISQGSFLFPFEMDKVLEDLLKGIVDILSFKNSPDDINEIYNRLVPIVNLAQSQFTEKIEKVLKLDI